MGYVRDTIYKLHFEAPEMKGLEARCRSMSVREFQAVRVTLRAFGAERDAEKSDALFIELCEALAAKLKSWNVQNDDDGQVEDVPATLDGILSQDHDFVFAIINGWIATISGRALPAPLPKPSTDGRASVEGSIPMEPLSESQAS